MALPTPPPAGIRRRQRLGLEQAGKAQAPRNQPADLEERPPRQPIAKPRVLARSPERQHDENLSHFPSGRPWPRPAVEHLHERRQSIHSAENIQQQYNLRLHDRQGPQRLVVSGCRFAFLGQFFEQLLKIGTIAKGIEVGFGLESLGLQKTTRHGLSESRHSTRAVNLAPEAVGRAESGLILRSRHIGAAPIRETQAARLMAS